MEAFMGTLLLILFIIYVISIPTFAGGIIYGCLSGNELLIILPVFLFLITHLLLMFTFSKFILKRKIQLSNYNFFNFNKDENVEIIVKQENNKFIMTYKDKQIIFESDIPIFKKGMFIAYVVRNIRYKEVSCRLPLGKLFKRRIKLTTSKTKDLILNLDGKKIILIKDGISINKFTFINKAFYYKYLSMSGRVSFHISRTICKINEEIFQKGKMILP